MCWLLKARLQAQHKVVKALWRASNGAGSADVHNGVGSGVSGAPKPGK
jgi:hypothetical protein